MKIDEMLRSVDLSALVVRTLGEIFFNKVCPWGTWDITASPARQPHNQRVIYVVARFGKPGEVYKTLCNCTMHFSFAMTHSEIAGAKDQEAILLLGREKIVGAYPYESIRYEWFMHSDETVNALEHELSRHFTEHDLDGLEDYCPECDPCSECGRLRNAISEARGKVEIDDPPG